MIDLTHFPPEVQTQISILFIEGMIKRMGVSFYKYGDLRLAYPHKINSLESAQTRINKYLETGNTEFLIDAANQMMIEFMCPSVPNAFFRATDSDESPGRTERSSGESVPYENRDLL